MLVSCYPRIRIFQPVPMRQGGPIVDSPKTRNCCLSPHLPKSFCSRPHGLAVRKVTRSPPRGQANSLSLGLLCVFQMTTPVIVDNCLAREDCGEPLGAASQEMGTVNTGKLGYWRPGADRMCTGFPQIAVTACITCEQSFFFARKACALLSLCQVEKKSAGIVLLCRPFPK